MRFSDIKGHDEVKKRLVKMVDEDRLPHALLIYGPEGSGKLLLARALTSYLHCTNRTPDGDSCGRCPSCLQHAGHNHVDTHFTFPIIKKRTEDPGYSSEFVEQWKDFLDERPYADFHNWLERLGKPNGQPVIYKGEAEALIKEMSLTARTSEYKVAIVWLPEKFNKDSANKLLKLIEEPYSDTKFIFVSNEAGSILPTIYSRLQRIEVKPLSNADVADVLGQLSKNAVGDDILDVVNACAGNVNEAMSMLNGGKNDEMLTLFINLMRLAFQKKVGELKLWSEEVAALGREGQMAFLNYCCRMLRENFVNNTGLNELTKTTKREGEFNSKFSRFINSGNVIPMMTEFERAISDIEANGNAKIILFDLAIYVIMSLKS